MLPDNAEMLNMTFDPPLDITKYVITMKMLFPTVGKSQTDLDHTFDLASKKIIDVAEKYDVPQAVMRHGLFDPNYYGKPQSIVRLALASARSQERQMADDEYILKVFDNFYLKNIESVMESWDEVMTVKGVELVSLNEFDRQVFSS